MYIQADVDTAWGWVVKYVDHTGSSFAILFGLISIIAGISTVSKEPSDVTVHLANIGISLFIGGLIYRSSKNRRFDWANPHTDKIILEVLGALVILLLLLGAGVSGFKNTLANDPAWPIIALITVFTWLVSNMMPKSTSPTSSQNEQPKELNIDASQSMRNEGEGGTSISQETEHLIEPGLYLAEGVEFRIFSSGRISLLKSDIKPLGGETTEFKTIGWLLRAFPDIDISLSRRLSD